MPMTFSSKYIGMGNNAVNITDPTGESWYNNFDDLKSAYTKNRNRAWKNTKRFLRSDEFQIAVIIGASILTGGTAGIILAGAGLSARNSIINGDSFKETIKATVIGATSAYIIAAIAPATLWGAVATGAGVGLSVSVLTGGSTKANLKSGFNGAINGAVSNKLTPKSSTKSSKWNGGRLTE